MAEMSSGAALTAASTGPCRPQEGQAIDETGQGNPRASPAVLDTGWDSLVQAHRLMAAIPRDAVDEAVLTQQLSVHRMPRPSWCGSAG